MQTLKRLTRTRPSAIRNLEADGWLPLLFAAWLLLAVVTPEEVYRTFFHALIYPLTIYLLVRKDKSFIWTDSFIRLFLLFCCYMSVTTWLVGDGPVEGDIQAVRWGLEAALGMLAFFLWMLAVVTRDRLWGRWFLFLALAGALGGLLSSLPEAFSGTRIEGLGVMGHPIQGGSIAIIFLATGLFLTFREKNIINPADIFLAAVSVVSVCIFVTLSQSRAPLLSLAIYLFFFAVLLICQYRRPTTIYIVLLVAACVAGFIQWFIGLDELYEQLLLRGASYRLDIWTAYLTYLPESLILGNGAGLDFELTDAARLYLEPMGLDIAHPHNIWLGAFLETGLIGIVMQAGLVILPVIAVFRSRLHLTSKLHLLPILGLFLLLTFTDEYTLLISLHPIWFIGWIPIVFVWTWSRYKSAEGIKMVCANDPGGKQ